MVTMILVCILCLGDGFNGFSHAMSHSAEIQRLMPLERWDMEALYSPHVETGRLYARFAATIDGIQAFDHTLFRLSNAEAVSMDPQGRILLEEVQELILHH